jgi:hypothetical protein
MEPPGGESGKTERTCGMYNKPVGCSTPAFGAPHNKQQKQNFMKIPPVKDELSQVYRHDEANYSPLAILRTRLKIKAKAEFLQPQASFNISHIELIP